MAKNTGKVRKFHQFGNPDRGGGGGWLPSMHHRSHDWGVLHPGGSASGGGLGSPPKHYRIWSISGRYACYLNAFLFNRLALPPSPYGLPSPTLGNTGSATICVLLAL